MGQGGALLGFRRLGMPVFSARSHALDGVSWVQGGEVENAVGWVGRVRQNRRRRLLPPWASLLAGAGCGLLSLRLLCLRREEVRPVAQHAGMMIARGRARA